MQVTKYLELAASQSPQTVIEPMEFHQDKCDSIVHLLPYTLDLGCRGTE